MLTPGMELAEVLEARARALAASPDDEDDSAAGRELVVLRTGEERFGLALDAVQECDRPQGLAALPGTPSFWRGLVNLRGTLHPVLDLRAALGGPATPEDDDPRVCIVAAGGVVAGLLVEEVEGIVRVRDEDLAPALPAAGGVDAWRGITADLVAVIDHEKLLTSPQLVVDQGAAA
jgi:chemotaxis signal transduction protein